jgi:hypothetical protein
VTTPPNAHPHTCAPPTLDDDDYRRHTTHTHVLEQLLEGWIAGRTLIVDDSDDNDGEEHHHHCCKHLLAAYSDIDSC